LPLHTLRADIDYGFAEARTTYGVIGIKTWIYKGEILGDQARRQVLGGDPEPRRPRVDRRGPAGDRNDRGDRRGPRPGGFGDRGPRPGGFDRGGYAGGERSGFGGGRPPQQQPEQQAPAGEAPRQGAPIMPPLANPQPSWKPEAGGTEAKPEGEKGSE
jgi:hypothetical protein